MAKRDEEIRKYAEDGMRSYLPGMLYLRDQILELVNQFETRIKLMRELEGLEPEPEPERKMRDVVAKGLKKRRTVNGGKSWAGMSTEERSVEMKRRFQVSKAKKAAAAAVKAKKAQWARKTPAQKKAWLAAMQAGRKKAQQKPMRLEVAS